MPGMDGFTLIAELRSRPALARLPAVLVTSRDSDADRRRGAQVGAQGYVVKSKFDQHEVLALIGRLIR
jgi:two-component system, chemotaxis family, sensor kinase CheA